MKTLTLLAISLFTGFLSLAQANKFEKGDFGISYQVSFNGSVNQSINLSGMVTPNIEIGSGIGFNYTNNKSYVTDSSMENTINGLVPALHSRDIKQSTFGLSVNPYMFYHFPVKSNLDVYIGPQISVGANSDLTYKTTDTYTAEDYSRIKTQNVSFPLSVSVGGSVVGGCRFFFYKKLALGLQGSLGAVASINNGSQNSVTVENNSGANNYRQGETTVKDEVRIKSTSVNTHSIGSIGVNLTFYFGKKAAAAGVAN